MSRMLPLLAVVLVFCVSAPSWCRAELPVPILKGIRVFPAADSFGVEITADKDFVYTCTKIPPLRKIVIDLPGTEPGRPDAEFRIDSALVADIRFAKIFINDVLMTRILINLKEDADYSASLDPADRKKLTVMLRKSRQASATAASPATAPDSSTSLLQTTASQTAVNPDAPAPPAVVTVNAVKFGPDAIDIHTHGPVADFKAFTLTEPGRLVIDIPDARSGIQAISVPANSFGIVTARIGIFGDKLRLVFDKGRQPFPGYRVAKSGTGLQVRLTQK